MLRSPILLNPRPLWIRARSPAHNPLHHQWPTLSPLSEPPSQAPPFLPTIPALGRMMRATMAWLCRLLGSGHAWDTAGIRPNVPNAWPIPPYGGSTPTRPRAGSCLLARNPQAGSQAVPMHAPSPSASRSRFAPTASPLPSTNATLGNVRAPTPAPGPGKSCAAPPPRPPPATIPACGWMLMLPKTPTLFPKRNPLRLRPLPAHCRVRAPQLRRLHPSNRLTHKPYVPFWKAQKRPRRAFFHHNASFHTVGCADATNHGRSWANCSPTPDHSVASM